MRSYISTFDMLRSFGLFLLGALLAMVLAELIFRVLPVSTTTMSGRSLDPLLITYPPHHHWKSSTGWDLRNAQLLRANNYGFASERDFAKNPHAVGLIGDSMIEAAMLNAADRPDAQLERALIDRPVYGLPGPGSSLLDYAERIRWASENLGLRDFVVLLERGDLRQSICGSGNNHGPCLEKGSLQPSVAAWQNPSAVKRVVRHSALAQYMFGQIMLSPERLWKQAVLQARPAEPELPKAQISAKSALKRSGLDELLPEEIRVAEEFFARVKPFVQGRLVLLLDGNRQGVYRGEASLDHRLLMLTELARQHGAQVIDLQSVFSADFKREGLKFEVGPYDAHYNAHAVGAVMGAAAAALAQPRPQPLSQ